MAILGTAVVTDRDCYAPGAPIVAELTAFTRGGAATELHFVTAQRYDFEIEREDGSLLWRWSDGRGFAQMLGVESLGAGRDAVTYRETFPAPQRAGRYRLVGRLTSTGIAPSAIAALRVDAPE